MSREMRDSGVEWIGEIPTDWESASLRKVLRYPITDGPHETPTYLDDGIPFVSVDSLNESENIDLSIVKKYISLEDYDRFNKKTQLNSADILFTKAATIGKTAIVGDEKFMVWSPIAVIKPNEELVHNKFMYFVLSAEKFVRYASLLGTNNTQINLGMRALEKAKISFPKNIDEQIRISEVLTEKVKELNLLIEKTKFTIEDYKLLKQSIITEAVTKGLDKNVEMKDSGIEWIGTMPAHWDNLRGKVILNKLSRPILDSDTVVTCFRDGQVTLRSNRREDGFTMADKEIGYQGVEPGDLVVHGMDGFAGAIGISDSRGKSSPVLNVLDSKQNKKYIMYYLRSMAYSDVFLAIATGIRVRSCDLRWNKIGDLPYPVPPIEEQEEIVKYIDNKLIQINEVIERKQGLLEQLETYKKSLIYEYVTGKKEVL